MKDRSILTPKGKPMAPPKPPSRQDLLTYMLEGTKRSFVPIRRTFIQHPPGVSGSRGAALSRLSRGGSKLDAYLLIHALASSSDPYEATYPASTWMRVARLDQTCTPAAAKSRWSKLVSSLAALRLIERERKGNLMTYRLLDESGDGTPYTRPKGTSDGNWLKLPHTYWLEEFDSSLSHPEKLMLLIALDQKDNFRLPFNRSHDWYGISEATARRGLRGLEERGLLSKTSSYVLSPKSPTGWEEHLRYTRQGPFSKTAINHSQASKRHASKGATTPDETS